ncbi:DUF21 domain-containing protein [Oceanicoccus sp. KOV_DT_Chl]|uniref:DUF21 domain-containing protein n=1 Tax=Oceanicoccus sp. KOV_DT_Chl TaxID=1904639 RepID=UPI000C7E5BB4|nr:DUF21 domain-containing protein [Oceanicoccus sp. KOV_DT_Chl]
MIWFGIAFCITQSAIFSGLNLAFFSLSRMQLEVEAERGVHEAKRILKLRENSNFLLCTILWGNVGINVLLTLLSNSVMAGVTAFLFSTIVITFMGEIFPQAYFSRNAMVMGSLLSPVLKLYQFLLYPVAKPSAWILDKWLGQEGIDYLRERDLKAIIMAHIDAEEAEVAHLEGIGAINFLAIDDLTASDEGEVIEPGSIIALPCKVDFPVIPDFKRTIDDPFLNAVDASGQSWVILTDDNDKPLLALDADGFLRDAIFNQDKPCDPYDYCHRPIVTKDPLSPLGDLIFQLKVNESDSKLHDGVIRDDVILLWGNTKKIITGSDILGRLLKGVSTNR